MSQPWGGEPFLLLGAGPRRKLLYRRGRLLDALTGELLRAWEPARERFDAGEYRVECEARGGRRVLIREDEEGVWLEEEGATERLARGWVSLPRFQGVPHAPRLRALHHEMLVNIVAGRPVPNLLVYPRPWYRDAAMVCMCLKATGNLSLVERWILGLTEPFDRNNAGDCEPDNLGQALYLVSLVSDASHPAVPAVLRAAREMTEHAHLVGPTDGAPHPVYQAKWMNYGLRALGLEDRYRIPPVYDSYSALFWMDWREAHVPGPRFDTHTTARYPYLAWAEAHFFGQPPPTHLLRESPPLTWEAEASQARYEGMRVVSPELERARTCLPHTWHAAEAFLYLHGLCNDPPPPAT